MKECKIDKLVNVNTPGIREFKYDTRVQFTIYADCMDTLIGILREIASLNITISACSFHKIPDDGVMIRIIVDNGAVQSEADLYSVKMLLKDCKVKFTMAKVIRAWFVYEGVGGYALLLNAVNKASTIKYSYVVDDGSIILGVKSLEKAIKALDEMMCK